MTDTQPQPSLSVEALDQIEARSHDCLAERQADDGFYLRRQERDALIAMARRAIEAEAYFQSRVQPWMHQCFGPEISANTTERNHRFIEEALELVQANGCARSEAHQIVDYVYDRDQGDINQEVGGVMVTLAALCLASGVDMHACAEIELRRVWRNIDKIRAKQAAKPKHSPLLHQEHNDANARIAELEAQLASLTAPLEGSEMKSGDRRFVENVLVSARGPAVEAIITFDRICAALDHATAVARTAAEEMRERCIAIAERLANKDYNGSDVADRIRAELPITPTETEAAEMRTWEQRWRNLHRLRPEHEYHEDLGPVLWWTLPIEEPPYVGSPLDTDWPGYHTHWSMLLTPTETGQWTSPT